MPEWPLWRSCGQGDKGRLLARNLGEQLVASLSDSDTLRKYRVQQTRDNNVRVVW